MVIENKKESSSNYTGFKLFATSIQSGLFGFSIFFTVLLASKYLSSLIGTSKVFKIDLSDVLLSLIGFILTFLISILKHFAVNEHEKTVIGQKAKK